MRALLPQVANNPSPKVEEADTRPTSNPYVCDSSDLNPEDREEGSLNQDSNNPSFSGSGDKELKDKCPACQRVAKVICN